MTRCKKTDGERIAATAWVSGLSEFTSQYREKLASDIDRLIRKRMAEAWEEGWFDRDCHEADWNRNPYRGGRRKK